jgi:hypothetical protein
MAKRPDYTPEKPFTQEQLSEMRRNFSLLSTPSLQTAYTERWNDAGWVEMADRQRRSTSKRSYRRGGSCGERDHGNQDCFRERKWLFTNETGYTLKIAPRY